MVSVQADAFDYKLDLKIDVIVGLQYGDEGKGKVTHNLCKTGDYTHVMRYNGGCNAGHTIYHNGKKFITHHIPAGVFYGIKSIIGPGCVVNPKQFFKEIRELNTGGIETDGLIFISENTHIITQEHLDEDGRDTKIGTTKRGNGPAYRDKYDRIGKRATTFCNTDDRGYSLFLRPYLINLYEELYECNNNFKILFEGAQGFGLDIDWGDYPYVTSSHCTAASALLNGIPPQSIRNVYGIAKIYETYVGTKDFHGNDPIFDKIQHIGEEFGATTGRQRQINWLNVDLLHKAVKMNGVTHLIINKLDILSEIGVYKVIKDNKLIIFNTETDLLTWLDKEFNYVKQIIYSRSKEFI